VAVPPVGEKGLGSMVSSEVHVPMRSRSAFISGAGLGICMPAGAFLVSAFLSAFFSWADAVKHSMAAVTKHMSFMCVVPPT